MATAPNGDLYAAVDTSTNVIEIHRSLEGPNSWYRWLWITPSPTGEARNPAITIVQDSGGEVWVFLTSELVHEDQTSSVIVDWFNESFTQLGSRIIDSNIIGEVHPEITTDYLEYPDVWYVYVSYAVFRD